MVTLTRAQPTQKTPRHPRRDEGIREPQVDPASLCATLRELALKAHHAVRATDGPGHELSELHAQIVQLQQNLRGQGLDTLASYVAALRQEIEDRLG